MCVWIPPTPRTVHPPLCLVAIVQVKLKDGREVKAPTLRWGKAGCYPKGSTSDISKDFVVRGVYYPQLVELLQSFHTVSAWLTGSTAQGPAVGAEGSLRWYGLSNDCGRERARNTERERT